MARNPLYLLILRFSNSFRGKLFLENGFRSSSEHHLSAAPPLMRRTTARCWAAMALVTAIGLNYAALCENGRGEDQFSGLHASAPRRRSRRRALPLRLVDGEAREKVRDANELFEFQSGKTCSDKRMLVYMSV